MADEDYGVLELIRDLRIRDPFVPFQITMTSGDRHTIQSSELLAIGKSQLIYCIPHSDRVLHLRFNQVASIEEFPLKTARKRKSA